MKKVLLGSVAGDPSTGKSTLIAAQKATVNKKPSGNEIKLADELVPNDNARPAWELFPTADQSAELTNDAVEYLKQVYEEFGGTRHFDAYLRQDLFSRWAEVADIDAAVETAAGGISENGFLSLWALMTLLNPCRAVNNLRCIKYPSDPLSGVHFTIRRRLHRIREQSERNVLQCFVFGPLKAGKSALLDSFIGRSFADKYARTEEVRYAANVVQLHEGSKKTLVLKEIPADQVAAQMAIRESLAPCDIAVFVYDSSAKSSWRQAKQLLLDVARRGSETGFEMPCIFVAAKADLDLFPRARLKTTEFTQRLGIEVPITVSSRTGDIEDVFQKIVAAATKPHLNIPDTEARRTPRRYVNRSLAVGAAGVAVVAVVAMLVVAMLQGRVRRPGG